MFNSTARDAVFIDGITAYSRVLAIVTYQVGGLIRNELRHKYPRLRRVYEKALRERIEWDRARQARGRVEEENQP